MENHKQLFPLTGLLCGLSVLPLEPPHPVSAVLLIGVAAMLASTMLFDARGRKAFLFKTALVARGALQMVAGKDKKWKKKGRPDPALVAFAKDKKTKRLIFIRHGESEWNLIFNVGWKIFVPFKAVAALVRETLMFLRLEDDSVLYDSPLNEEGLKQARELDHLLNAYDSTSPGFADVEALRGSSDRTSVVTSSNLRRAAQTVQLALATRLEKHPKEKVHILTALQEISTNIDTLAITLPFAAPVLGGVPRHLATPDRFDVSCNSGNKLLGGRGLQRLQGFSEWVFKRDEDVIIVGGHSLYFRYFFREFLPAGSNPLGARDSKVANGGIVSLTLERGTVDSGELNVAPQVQYRIVPESICEVVLGFDDGQKKKKKKKV
ncbi:histidine phosphatase superfamily [Pelagophyceae sp. CCMP2097]|nr:histidine phosphatase superfamily [Pelagophyceae sp. CCMP2097]